MKRVLLYMALFFLPLVVCAQRVALKSNVLYLATTTPNAGFEFAMSRHFSFDLWGAYNAFKFSNDMKINLYLAQPEFRYWPCRSFEGHFIGLHGHYGHYNIGQIPFVSSLKNEIYRGDLYGGGLSYGYHFVMGNRWGLELNIGGGYTNLSYTRYRCADCAEAIGSYKRNYYGVTRAGFSLIYMIR